MLRKAARGFTLIELMIVVAIIGILASIAIPNFIRYQLRSKSSEASVNLGAIKTSEIAYFGSKDVYAAAPANPAMPADGKRATFDKTVAEWVELGWQPEGQVYFEYAVAKTDAAGAGSPASFTAQARADLDVADEVQCWLFQKAEVDATGPLNETAPIDAGDCITATIFNQVFKSSADGAY